MYIYIYMQIGSISQYKIATVKDHIDTISTKIVWKCCVGKSAGCTCARHIG